MTTQTAHISAVLDSATTRCPNSGCGAEVAGARCSHCGSALRAGRWQIEAVLAQSAHSRVYRASDASGAKVALKELHFALVPSAAELDAFEREGKTLAAFQHPATPKFVEMFTEGTGVALRFYLATELIDGISLATRIDREGPLSEADVISIAEQALAVLVAMQSRSPALFHRDLKPANLMFRGSGGLVLVDFGAVRSVETSRTHRSTLVGTFGYMPPEQLGGTVDGSSDVYALAATMLHAVTGRAPSELIDREMRFTLPAHLSPPLRDWLERALSFDRTKRFRNAAEARDALRSRSTRSEKKVRPAFAFGLIAAVALGVAGFAAGLISHDEVPPPAPRLQLPQSWFARVRSRCNQLEVRQLMQRDPPPAGPDGTGDGAACFALGAKLEDARRLIASLPVEQRARAASRVFDVAHPVADQGDDFAAGPMMELVLEFWPQNFQALYHAGIAEYLSGDSVRAKDRLERFLSLYHENTNFRADALMVLDRIARGLPPESGSNLGRH